MEESALIEIESRMRAYPAEAQEDIARLIRELRRVSPAATLDRAQYTPPHLHDSATGLLNAAAYGLRFSMARARSRRYHNMFAVMSIDFDKLAASQAQPPDAMLKDVAERLQACLRATDTLARVAQTRFEIILEDLTQVTQAERVKSNVREALTESLDSGPAALVDIDLQFFPEPPRTNA